MIRTVARALLPTVLAALGGFAGGLAVGFPAQADELRPPVVLSTVDVAAEVGRPVTPPPSAWYPKPQCQYDIGGRNHRKVYVAPNRGVTRHGVVEVHSTHPYATFRTHMAGRAYAVVRFDLPQKHRYLHVTFRGGLCEPT